MSSRRLQKLSTFMDIALHLSTLSTCKRAKVGAIIVPDDFTQVSAIGYNGPIAGIPNTACTDVAGACGCVHAEANALIKFSRPLGTGVKYIMMTTTAPCMECAKLILNVPVITELYYLKKYRTNEGLTLLEKYLSIVRSLL